MPNHNSDLRGVLPNRVINEYHRSEQSHTPQTAERDRQREGHAHQGEPQCGIELHWCGAREAVLAVELDGRKFPNLWRPSHQNFVRLPASAGQHRLNVEKANGDPVVSEEVHVKERTWGAVNVGQLYTKLVCEPNGRSQFSFEDGRSACSFLCCNSAVMLWNKLKSEDLEITSADVLGGDIAKMLSQGMSRFSEQAKVYIDAAGLDHTSVIEVLELCGAVWDGEIRAASDGSFWGTLTDEESLHECLLQAIAAAYKNVASKTGGRSSKSVPIFVAITRPPETLLVVVLEDAQLYGVLDTHTRFVGTAQNPASFYQCASLRKLAEMLKATFFPLPEDMHPEELGMYAMFELTLLDVGKQGVSCQPSGPHAGGGLNVSEELDPDSVLL